MTYFRVGYRTTDNVVGVKITCLGYKFLHMVDESVMGWIKVTLVILMLSLRI